MSIEHPHQESPEIEQEKIERCKDLILTGEGYRDTPFAHAEARVYTFEITKGDKTLVYIGAPHTNDPADTLFADIEKSFEMAHPDMVYVEGWQAINAKKRAVENHMDILSLEDTKKEGESHFTLKLATDAGIDFESPEPDFTEEIAYILEKGFRPKDVYIFYMYRMIDQYIRQHEDPTQEGCRKYLELYIAEFRGASGWPESELDQLEQDIFSDITVGEPEKYKNAVDPIPWEGGTWGTLNDISSTSSNFRDRYMFERIVEGLKHHNKLFVVYGSAHAVKQEPALRAFLA